MRLYRQFVKSLRGGQRPRSQLSTLAQVGIS
jgi:hypothetical protein